MYNFGVLNDLTSNFDVLNIILVKVKRILEFLLNRIRLEKIITFNL